MRSRLLNSIKKGLDCIIDPISTAVALDSAYVGLSDVGLEWIAHQDFEYKGAAMLGAEAGLVLGFLSFNWYVTRPLAKKVFKNRVRKIKKKTPVTVDKKTWIRTGIQTAALAAGIYFGDVYGAVDNFMFDTKRFAKAAIRYPTQPVVKEAIPQPPLEKIFPEEYPQVRPEIQYTGELQHTGALEGKVLGNLHTRYTGISGTVPAIVSVNFKERLLNFWDEKERGATNKEAVREVVRNQVMPYYNGTPTTMTLDDYLKEIENSMKDVKDHIHWEQVRQTEGLNHEQLEVLKAISLSITPKQLLSYGLTELMPGFDGNKNVAVLDFLLRTAGREYVELLPSLADDYVSFGPYQFTSLALSEWMIGGKLVRGGVAHLRPVVEETNCHQENPHCFRIPRTMTELQGNSHHHAALVFGVHNLAVLVRATERDEFDVLGKQWPKKMGEVTQYIATSHHNPKMALQTARRWLDHGTKHPYEQSCNGRLLPYAQKTAANLKALDPQTQYTQASPRPAPPKRTPKVDQKTALRYERPALQSICGFSQIEGGTKQGQPVFVYDVRRGDTVPGILDQFSDCYHIKGDLRRAVSGPSITTKNLKSGTRVYVVARK